MYASSFLGREFVTKGERVSHGRGKFKLTGAKAAADKTPRLSPDLREQCTSESTRHRMGLKELQSLRTFP